MTGLGLGSRGWTRSLVAVATALLVAACTEISGTAPNEGHGHMPPVPVDPGTPLAVQANEAKGPDLGSCSNLALQQASVVVAKLYATGDQVYRWSGSSWVFVAPKATLYANDAMREQVGTHYAGPTWESNGGSRVIGTVVDRCTPNASAIPWLLLRAVSNDGAGTFETVTFIHRVKTVGGNAPSAPGAFVGELANVPYKAAYFFYRPQ